MSPRFSVPLLLLLTVISAPALALDTAAYRAINRNAVERHILPRYDALAAAMAGLAAESRRFCAAPSGSGLAPLQQAYNTAVDAWQDIQHVRFGPIDLFFRSQRIAFWPDARNTISKQMAEMLSQRDPDALSAERLAKGSVAVQGLPVLERLLFGRDAERLLSGDQAVFRCQYTVAISSNLAGMAGDTVKEWRSGAPPYALAVTDVRHSDGRYVETKDATLDLFKSLYTAVELVADHKLARPLGASLEQARPRLAEAWRSERSMRNITRNLQAAADLYRQAFAPAMTDAELDTEIRSAFDMAGAAAQAIRLPLEAAVQDRAMRDRVETLAAQVIVLKNLLLQKLPIAIDVPVGFNALDGD